MPLEHLYIEPGTTCSAECKHCPQTLAASMRPSIHIDAEQVIQRIEGMSFLQSVTLVGLGEPFEVPNILDSVYALSKRGIRVDLTTNGSTLANLDARSLIYSGISKLTVSLDSAEPHLQHKLRPKHTIEYILSQIQRINSGLEDLGSLNRIRVTVVRTKSTLISLRNTLAVLANKGVQEVLVKNITLLQRDFAKKETLIPDSEVTVHNLNSMLRSVPAEVSSPLKIVVALNGLSPSSSSPPQCPYHPLRSAFMTAEGNLYPCYFIGLDEILSGNHFNNDDASLHPDFRFPGKACQSCPVFNETYRIYNWNPAAISQKVGLST